MAKYYPAGGKTYTLGASIGSTDTTITLSSFTLPVSGILVTMAVLNTDIAYGTIAPKTSSSEFISFTGITQNANGTATLTGVVRGLDRVYPFTTNASYKLPHSGQSIFILSDAPQVFNEYGALKDANTWAGLNVFSVAPQANVDPVSPNDLTRLSYVQALVLGTLTTINVIVPGKAGATIASGQFVYYDDPTNTWLLTDATNSAKSNNVLLGIAQGAGTAGNPITNGVLLQGYDSHQTGLVEGQAYYLSNTPGAIATTPGTNNVIVGLGGTTATSIYFAPRFNQMLTQSQIDALAGDDGTPSSTNKFVTQSGFQKNAEKYIADGSASSTAYTATFSPAVTAYTAGMSFFVKIGLSNTTTTPTLNVNGLGAKTIVKNVSDALSLGDILANQFCTFIYDGVNMVLQTQNSTGFLASGAPGTTVANATTTVLTFPLAGGILGTSKGVRIRFTIRDVESGGVSGVAPLVTIAYGGTTIGSWSITAAAGNRTIDVITETVLLGSGATSTQRANSFSLGNNSLNIVGLSQNSAAIDSTTSQNITIAIASPNANLTVTFVDYLIQKIV